MIRRTSLVILFTVLASGCSDNAPAVGVGLLRNVTFETRAVIPIGVDHAGGVALADLTGDGMPDLAVADLAGSLQIMVGQRPQGFAPGRAYPISGRAIGVGCGDFNGDEAADVLVLCHDTAMAEVLLNDGQGDLTSGQQLGIGAGVLGFAIGDLDGDEVLDFAVAGQGAAGVAVHLGNGDGTFASAVVLPLDRGEFAAGLAIGDLDGDDRNDLVLCDTDADRAICLLSQPQGLPQNEVHVPVGRGPTAVALGDVTADGQIDVVVSNLAGETVSVLTHDASGGFTLVQTLEVDGQPSTSTIGDVSGDGVPDLVVSVLDRRTVSVFEGQGGALATRGTQLSVTGSPFDPVVADTNGDAVSDLVVFALGADVANVYFGRGDGLAAGRLHEIARVRFPELVAAADFDRDRRSEVAVSGLRSTAVVFFDAAGAPGTGDPVLTERASIELGRKIQNLVPVDVDRDYRVDLLVAVEGGIRILRNDSTLGLLLFEVIPVDGVLAPGAGPFEMIADDIDRDGAIDLVIAYHGSGRIALARGIAGRPFEFEPPVELALSGRPFGLASGEFDGDARREIAVSRLDAAMVTIVDLDASGALAVSMHVPVGSISNYLRASDFNRDGLTDLVVSNAESDSVSLLVAERGGGFSQLDVGAGQRPTALLARDLNGDGFPDILVASLTGTDFRIVLGDGHGGVMRSIEFAGTYGAVTAAFADLNGNGLQDLLIGSLFTRRLAAFKNVSSPTDE